ncbi:MAG TPA: hypothetical protein VN658_10500 [Candidatus Acidoferrales bacterium]|nr:hypothetical protein [Candidatus Acidoferrales bacterium]
MFGKKFECMSQFRSMVRFNIFSQREKRLSGQKPDVYEYDTIPPNVRVQIVHILKDVIGDMGGYFSKAGSVYQRTHDALAREYGVFNLTDDAYSEPVERLFNFVLRTPDAKKILDAIEMSIVHVAHYTANYQDYKSHANAKMDIPDAIEEINFRFQEAGIGYQFESGHMVRVDSHFLHSTVVKPALVLLSDRRYAGAEQEFLKAHEHYRKRNYKECLVECLKAFESTMKAICKARKWQFKDTDTAKTLIDALFQKGLIPSSLQNEINNLRSLLESGVPTLRNKMGGHGQGSTPISVPPYFAAYALHLTAANILLLVDAEKG